MTVKESVLAALENNRNDYLSGEDLSRQLGVSRAAVFKAVKALRNEGYEIEAVTNRGYMMPSDDPAMTESAVRNALPASMRGMDLRVYDIIDSTNLQARRLLLGGQPGGAETASAESSPLCPPAVIISGQQTAGRGRLGRSFYSPKDGLYLSVVIRPDFDISRASLVTVAAAAATSEAIDEICSCGTQIKWVNDIYLGDKKVCGILTEATTDFETGQIDSLIIGIGINTSDRSFPPELKDIAGSISARELTGHEKSLLAAGITRRVLSFTGQLHEDGPWDFVDLYRSRSMLLGKDITVYTGTYRKDPTQELGGRSARVMGIDDNGGLMVRYEDGTSETLTSGEVSVRLP